MISKTKQDWQVGATVKVGFLTLVVKAAVPTPGDFQPDAYILTNTAGSQLYMFVPHNGVRKIDVAEARELLAEAEQQAARIAAAAIKKAAAANDIAALFA
ncbi:hypothetical protein [Ralstonia holmesii]|uniref:hypothetical protein n=1 Tax=Ralstonia holmesii TaxID=3058602 RepID=UPI0028F5CFB2|nr:hypothetical protein [Ralstonia sp. LMG 32967]CAJ0698684.1 hypothetical protein R11007_02860 [Ralstonia sp. LMG 32967]